MAGSRSSPFGADAPRIDTERSPGLELEEAHVRLRAALERERGMAAYLRALPTQGRIAIAAVAIGLTLVLPRLFVHVHVAPVHVDAALRWRAPAARSAIVYGSVLVALLWTCLWPFQRPRSQFLDVALVAAGLATPFALVDFAPGGACGVLRHLGYCFFVGTAVGWGLLFLLRALDRGDHEDRTVAWLAVGVASLATNLALQFDCPDTGAMHRLTCHATIGLALGLQYLGILHWRESRRQRRRERFMGKA